MQTKYRYQRIIRKRIYREIYVTLCKQLCEVIQLLYHVYFATTVTHARWSVRIDVIGRNQMNQDVLHIKCSN